MADIDEPQPGGVLFETADGRLSWRPRRAGSINKSHLHIIQEAWAISDGDGANLTTRQLLMLNHLPIIQRRKRASNVYNSVGKFKTKYAHLTTVSDELLKEIGLERHHIPRLGSAGLKKRNKAQQMGIEWNGMPVNDEMAAGASSVEEGHSTFSTDGDGYLRGPAQRPFASHDKMHRSQENWVHYGYQLPPQQMHPGQENWFRHDDNAGTGYQPLPQKADPIHTPTSDNPIYAQYVEPLQSGAIPAGYQEFDQHTSLVQEPLPENIYNPMHTPAPDNQIYAQYISLVQSGAYQIFDQRTGLLQQPLPENMFNPNAVLIPCAPQHPSDSTPSSTFTSQASVRCYSSPYGPLPQSTGINQAPAHSYSSPYDPPPPDTQINQPPVSIQAPEIRDREEVERPRRRRYNRTFAAQIGWFDAPSASPESGSGYEPESEPERDI